MLVATGLVGAVVGFFAVDPSALTLVAASAGFDCVANFPVSGLLGIVETSGGLDDAGALVLGFAVPDFITGGPGFATDCFTNKVPGDLLDVDAATDLSGWFPALTFPLAC